MKLKYYSLTEETPEYSESINKSYSLASIIEEANLYDSQFENEESSIMLSTYTYEATQKQILKALCINEDESEEITEYSIEEITEYFIDTFGDSYFESEGEAEILRVIGGINEKTEGLIYELHTRLSEVFGKYIGKYSSIELDGETRTMRIADHTHNPRNGKCDINIVICNKNATQHRFITAKEDLIYNEDATVEEIMEDIMNFF